MKHARVLRVVVSEYYRTVHGECVACGHRTSVWDDRRVDGGAVIARMQAKRCQCEGDE